MLDYMVFILEKKNKLIHAQKLKSISYYKRRKLNIKSVTMRKNIDQMNVTKNACCITRCSIPQP
jgi:hypothetical protein